MQPVIDSRVHYVGMTALRTLSFDRLPEEEIYVLQDRGKPVAVLMPYALYMDMQQAKSALQSASGSPEDAK